MFVYSQKLKKHHNNVMIVHVLLIHISQFSLIRSLKINHVRIVFLSFKSKMFLLIFVYYYPIVEN